MVPENPTTVRRLPAVTPNFVLVESNVNTDGSQKKGGTS